MASPFPGMDPYLESHWRDVHHRLITYACDAIQEALPVELRARVEERVVLATSEGIGHQLYPDLRVIESRPQGQGATVAVIKTAASESILIDAEIEALTEGVIEIIDAGSGNRIVTIIEFLSPTNKMSGEERENYLRKQREIVQSETNLVEIDLLRTGKHVLAFPFDNLPERLRTTTYRVCIRRSAVPSKAEVYAIPLAARLPTVKIPLRPGDTEVALNLQALIDDCYRKGRYESDLNYRLDAAPPLTGKDAEWAAELLRNEGLRPAESTK